MSDRTSLLDELRTQYEAARQSTHEHADVEAFQVIDARADYETGLVTVALVNVDRLDRVTLEFHSNAIDEPVLEDLVRLMLGRDSAFLRRAPLAGLHGRPPAGA